MSGSKVSTEERRRITNARQAAVRNAWKKEKLLVEKGQGTRDWSKAEQQEMMKRGSVKGYDGHHMKSVSKYPQYAGEPKNIQFLNKEEHLAAHGGDTHNPTNGYYDPKTKKMYPFKGNELKPAPERSLVHKDKTNSSFSDKKKENTKETGKERSAAFRRSLNNSKNGNTRKASSPNAKTNNNGNKR